MSERDDLVRILMTQSGSGPALDRPAAEAEADRRMAERDDRMTRRTKVALAAASAAVGVTIETPPKAGEPGHITFENTLNGRDPASVWRELGGATSRSACADYRAHLLWAADKEEAALAGSKFSHSGLDRSYRDTAAYLESVVRRFDERAGEMARIDSIRATAEKEAVARAKADRLARAKELRSLLAELDAEESSASDKVA